MSSHDYLVLCRQDYTFSSNLKAVPPVPPHPNLMGGDKSRGICRKSRGISPGARGGDQSRGIKTPEMVTLHSITLNNFCFYLYAQNLLSHSLAISHSLSFNLSFNHSRHAEHFLFSCLCSKLTVYGRKWKNGF